MFVDLDLQAEKKRTPRFYCFGVSYVFWND